MTIFLIRHAESQANLDETLFKTIGDHNIALSPEGHKQAALVGQFMNNYLTMNIPKDEKIRLWASPYLRTTQTAQGILENTPDVNWDISADGDKIFYDVRLREREFGLFDGLTDPEIEVEYPNQWQHFQKMIADNGKYYARPAGGESGADVALRLQSFYETLWRDINKGIKHHVIVNHGFTLRCFVTSFLHRHPASFMEEKNPSNTAVRLLDKDGITGHYQDKGYIFDPKNGIALQAA